MSTVQLPFQKRGHFAQFDVADRATAEVRHEIIERDHGFALSQNVVATTKSPSRTVRAIRRSTRNSGEAAARSGPSATKAVPSAWSACTVTLRGPSGKPRPSALPTASL